MIVVADSGSTSIDWRVISDSGIQKRASSGINPLYQSEEEIYDIFAQILGENAQEITAIYFYGAGIVSEEQKSVISGIASKIAPKSKIVVDSDLLGAAIALFGEEAGVVAILGTGSNSALYDGKTLVSNIKAGGYILGDEGSGANIGKVLLSDYVKGLLPEELTDAIESRYGLSYPVVVGNLYKGGAPSRYLAQFTYIVKEYQEHPYIDRMLQTLFSGFFERNIIRYNKINGKIRLGLVGSVAVVFEEQIRRVSQKFGVEIYKIEQSAGDGLCAYFQNKK